MYFMLITNKIGYTKPQNIKYINSNRKKKVLSKKPRFTVYDCESEQLLVRLEGAQLQGDSVGCSNAIAFSDQPAQQDPVSKTKGQYTLYRTIY